MQKVFNPIDLGDSIYVGFSVINLPSSKIIWINERWLIDSGIDPFDNTSRVAVAQQLLNTFAVTAENIESESATSEHRKKYLYADRYGGTGGLIHGGSGRCGASGSMIAKGIGKTPLVSESADIYHKNGRAWASEAIKEILCAEICNRELPWGAVPVIAVIDTGLSYPSPDASEKRRSVIIIRPTVIRPAHFERSIYFGRGGRESEQFYDALRVKSAVTQFFSAPEKFISLLDMFCRFAQQMGAARALRLWQGRFISSNISIDGAILDFGSFRTTPNWSRAIGLAGECFGTELYQLKNSFLSVASYFAKYCPESVIDINPKDFINQLYKIENDSFLNTSLNSIGVDVSDTNLREKVSTLLSAYYKSQQSRKVEATKARKCPWIYQAYSDSAKNSLDTLEHELKITLDKIASLFPSADGTSKAKQFFNPRLSLSYSVLEKKGRLMENLLKSPNNLSSQSLEMFINRQITKYTMWTAVVKSDLVPLSVYANCYCCVVRCARQGSDEMTIWIKAAFRDGFFFLLGKKIHIKNLAHTASMSEHSIEFEIPTDQFVDGVLCVASMQLPLTLFDL